MLFAEILIDLKCYKSECLGVKYFQHFKAWNRSLYILFYQLIAQDLLKI